MRLSINRVVRTAGILILVGVLVFFSIQYVFYIETAKTTVPFSDYVHWIAIYGEKVLNRTISFKDYFSSDLGEHIQPIAMAINFTTLRLSDFNVAVLVESGAFLRIFMALILVAYFWFSFKASDFLRFFVKLLTSVALFLCVINYNQWEIATEPFSFGNVVRLISYFLSFVFISLWINKVEERSVLCNIILSFLVGVYCAFLTLFMGGAYFVGHLVGIGITLLIVLFQKRKKWKNYFVPMSVWAVVSFVSALIYYMLLLERGTAVGALKSSGHFLLVLLEGVCFFWGAVFIPSDIYNQLGMASVSIIGAAVLIVSFCIFLQYVKQKKTEKSTFPVICFMYALVTSVAITLGRFNSYGIDSMASSRYVIESSIGLFGVLWMAYSISDSCKAKLKESFKTGVVIVLSIVLLLQARDINLNRAPYMQQYFENLKDQMYNINLYADDELTGFGAYNVQDVRYVVKFLEENNLSVFDDKSDNLDLVNSEVGVQR